jgi:hypothetical protein
MAGPAPKTRDWQARENAHKPKGYHVIVTGLVEVSALNKEPHLTEEAERNPKNLGLKLTIETVAGEGGNVVVWKAVKFHKEVKRNQYDHVVVRWNVDQIANIPIVDDKQYAAAADAAMKVLNQKYPAKGKPAKPAAGKPAPKQPATKKAAPKKAAAKKKAATKAASAKKKKGVGGWAKSKKAKAKKAPKKAAKKKSAARKKRR